MYSLIYTFSTEPVINNTIVIELSSVINSNAFNDNTFKSTLVDLPAIDIKNGPFRLANIDICFSVHISSNS